MKINETRRWGNVAHVVKDGLLKAFNANDVKDEVMYVGSKLQNSINWCEFMSFINTKGDAIFAKLQNYARK